jgi:hypothetical protein
MEDRSEISYWFEDENILTVPTSKVPHVGEVIHFDTQMDRMWYESNFPKTEGDKFFNEGVRGHFVVTHVKRYYKNYDIKHETDFGIEGSSTYVLPMQITVESFEVYLEKPKHDGVV